MMCIEAHLGRPDRFDMSPGEFEELLRGLFDIEQKEASEADAMILYYLRCKK